MSSTVANSGSEPVNPVNVATPRPATSQDAWNAPIFHLPGEGERQATVDHHAAVNHGLASPQQDPPVHANVANQQHVSEPADATWLRGPNSASADRRTVAPVSPPPVPVAPVSPPPVPVAPVSALSVPDLRAVTRTQSRFTRGETSQIWGLRLDCIGMTETVDAIAAMIAERTPRFIITANLNYAMLLDRDESLQSITDDASLVLADGQPLVWRSHIGAAARLPERVAGSELIYRIAERAAQHGWRIYFLGAQAGVAQRCAQTLARQYPGLQIAGVQCPPYRALSETEQQQQRQAIIDSGADVLLVAFGQPKGERWIHQHFQQLGVPVSIQVGASFDFVAGTAKRAPQIWQRLGLEWCYRMYSDPWRLLPRYASNAAFLFLSLIRDWRDYVNSRYGVSADGASRGH